MTVFGSSMMASQLFCWDSVILNQINLSRAINIFNDF